MVYIPFEIKVRSAEVFKNVNFFSKMNLYTTVSLLLQGDPYKSVSEKKTCVDHHGGSHPYWLFTIKFQIDESKLLQDNLSTLVFQVKCRRNLGDKDIGIVSLPIKDLYDDFLASHHNINVPKHVAHTIKSKSSGKINGVLYFSYMFGHDNGNSTSTARHVDIGTPAAALAPNPTPSAPYWHEDYLFTPNPIGSVQHLPVPSAPYLED